MLVLEWLAIDNTESYIGVSSRYGLCLRVSDMETGKNQHTPCTLASSRETPWNGSLNAAASFSEPSPAMTLSNMVERPLVPECAKACGLLFCIGAPNTDVYEN